MTIVPITPENLDNCIPIFLKSYNLPPWNYHWTHEKAKQYLSEYLDCKHFIGFVLYDQDQAVGAVLGHRKTWWTNQQLMIDELFISPEKQKMGYGKKLLELVDQYAKEKQIGSLFLMTNKYMPAYKFYNTIDYTTLEQFVFMFKQIPLE